jgi:anti-sigma regulatory factor (Ser/Thr protein kinase)
MVIQQSRSTRPAGRGGAGRQKRGPGSAHPPVGPSRVKSLSWSFPGTAADVSCSRRWLAVAATELWGEGDDTDRLVLAYSEIATNAVVHGTGPVTVAARICADCARCEVADNSAQLPRARQATSADVGGRGLDMVRHTVDRLRVTADEIGKTVSFEVGRRSGDATGMAL